MRETVPVSVGIPTWARGKRVLGTLERIFACDPLPAEIVVHVDASDGNLEQVLRDRFPSVQVLTSRRRVGPGGGRHRCVMAASQPYFVSFDDDSWPTDPDFFGEVVRLFKDEPATAILAAMIHHPGEAEPVRTEANAEVVEYTGCGYALRRCAYLEVPGHIDNPIPYGFEEIDLVIQLLAAGWKVRRAPGLRVYHETQLQHHVRAEIVAGTIHNAALIAWLRYPPRYFVRGVLQVTSVFVDQVRRRRWRGLGWGAIGLPFALWRHRQARAPVASEVLAGYFPRRHRPMPRRPVHL
jgi:GT2 family glycosyltransferase